ncbi:hypothetical protein APICC_09386 [Apis cerana cerana]|uniref:NAD(+) kinase n=1 Tax=Apis cerana cerana TaxID=94128 RepID=A0A2A3EE52_APICC|nr:hypothetical protein APICC_09386 [Apis cerana cerana]
MVFRSLVEYFVAEETSLVRASLREDRDTLSGFNGQCPLRRKFRGTLVPKFAGSQGARHRGLVPLGYRPLSAKYRSGHVSNPEEHVSLMQPRRQFLNYLNNTYRPRKILCVSKLTSLEYLRSQNSDLNVDQILSKMKGEGQNPDDILAEHQRQIACEQNLISVLNKLDISFRITKRLGIASRFMNWADLVVTIGGDGMFLLASKLITNNTKPVCGINPNISKKNTFTLPSKYVTDIESIFEKLYKGDYDTLMRSRIKTIMVGEGLFRRPFHIHEKSREFGEKRHNKVCKLQSIEKSALHEKKKKRTKWFGFYLNNL